MLPSKILSNTINNRDYFRSFTRISLVFNWGWSICFLMISVFNGWMIKVSQVEPLFLSEIMLKQILVVYFALFPLAPTIHNFFRSTKLLVATIISSWVIVAIILCYLNLPALNSVSLSLLVLNILVFAFILIFVCKTRGIVIPAFVLFFVSVLTLSGLSRWALDVVLYCNLVVIVNRAGRQLKKALDSFDGAMLSLSGIAAVGLAVGWVMGGFSG